MPTRIDLSFIEEPAALKRIVIVALACGIAGGAYAALAPRWYRSVVTVVPAAEQKTGISTILGANLGGLAAGFEGAFGGADAARIAVVLQSVSVTDAVIERFDLRTRYAQETTEGTRDALWAHCSVTPFPKASLVELSCEDKDPRFVQQMLGFFAEHGNDVFSRVNASSVGEQIRFLERHVAELRLQAEETSDRMRQFQEKHNIVDLETQAEAVVSTLASLEAQRINKRVELDYARSFSAEDEPTVRQLVSQLGILDDNLRGLQTPQPPASAGDGKKRRGREEAGGFFPPAGEVPRLRSELEALYRDRKVAEATLIFALERLEAARADQAREASTFLVLDPPTLPTRHSRPRKLLSTLVAAALGFVLSAAAEYSRRSSRAVAIAEPAPRSGDAAA